ncbi:hypothetical protein EDB89DRAFT_1914348 [Lactarius sanguifluus]|nr:hypothetical protein EDB89DRAFT_1914348 [Lactarius sanguifluus]
MIRGLVPTEENLSVLANVTDSVQQPLHSFHEKSVTLGWNFNDSGLIERDRVVFIDCHFVVVELIPLDHSSANLRREHLTSLVVPHHASLCHALFPLCFSPLKIADHGPPSELSCRSPVVVVAIVVAVTIVVVVGVFLSLLLVDIVSPRYRDRWTRCCVLVDGRHPAVGVGHLPDAVVDGYWPILLRRPRRRRLAVAGSLVVVLLQVSQPAGRTGNHRAWEGHSLTIHHRGDDTTAMARQAGHDNDDTTTTTTTTMTMTTVYGGGGNDASTRRWQGAATLWRGYY